MEFQRVNRKLPLVPIIPLIDILAILLIYFAVAYDPKVERPTIPVQMALAQDSIVIKVTGTTSVLAIAEDGTVMLDATRVHDDLLVDYLKVFKEKFPDRKLEIKPDGRLQFANYVRIYQALHEAGIDPSKVLTRVRVKEQSGEEESTNP